MIRCRNATVLMRILKIYAFFLLVIPAFSQSIYKGHLDLSNYKFSESGNLKLDGEWIFYWRKFIHPDSVTVAMADGLIPVPGNWFSFNQNADLLDKAYGYGTYVLTLYLPDDGNKYAIKLSNIQTAYKLFINGKETVVRGTIGTTKATSIPNAQTAIVGIPTIRSDTIKLVLHASNFHFPSTSGIWSSLEIGTFEKIVNEKTKQYFISSFLIGSLFIMGLYHIAIYFMRKKDSSTIFFAVVCLCLALREIFSGEVIVFDLFPGLSWQTGLRILILCFPISFYFFFLFLRRLYPHLFSKQLNKALFGFCVAFAASVIVFSATVYMQLMLLFNVVGTIMAIYMMVRLIYAARNKLEGSGFFVFGCCVLILSAIYDTLLQTAVLTGTFTLPIAFFIFILCQSLVLAIRFTNSFKRVAELSDDLLQTNTSYARFVPIEFSNFLNRGDITEVQLGDGKEAEMTVLFADIKGFTTLAEKMSPQETFAFINSALGKTGPLIRKYNGFIDKYIGDAIMAIFPSNPEDALRAAVEIQKSVQGHGHFAQLQYGIGIHTGKLILGIIGEPERLESTVISDTVNIASRVEGLTRKYDFNIIVTEDLIKMIPDVSKFTIHYIDTTVVKGRDEPIKIYGVTPSG